MKKVLVLVALISVLGVGSVFAHDAGDLMMHLEPQIGLSIPTFENVNNKALYGSRYSVSTVGLEFGFTIQIHYWFLDFLGANVGFGFNMGIDTATESVTNQNSDPSTQDFVTTRAFLYIPFGARFNIGVLVAGLGCSYNMPLGDAIYTYGNSSGEFAILSYLGWYFDLGFDLSGQKDAGGGFGMALRLAGSFAPIDNHYNVNYSLFSISLVFSPAIELVNFNKTK